ncbi:MAG TPA: serine/threonine-protein kinase [Polyangiaceae bacterium]|nr:serine/threonine-protein kinase [Polyangiaceae bacterium]
MLPSWTLDAGGVTTPLSLPAHFDRALGDRPTRYLLRTRVELPPDMRDRDLALTIPYFAALVSLSAGGVKAEDLDAGALERYRGAGPHRFVIPAAETRDGELSLEMTVEHRWTQSAWLDTVPRLSEGRDGDSGYVFVKLFNEGSDAAALAMLVVVGFANGIIFLADRRRTAYGWFTGASFLGAAYAAFSVSLTQPLFGGYDSCFMGAAVLLSALMMMRFTAGVFGRPLWRGWWALIPCYGVVAISNAGPFGSTHRLAPITILAILVAGVYCVNLLVQEMRRGRPPLANILVTIGWPVVCIAACDDFASWLGLGELYYGVRGSCLGQTVLALFQAAALGSQLMESLRRSDRLNAELAGQVAALQQTNAEVETLNEELRRQIGNRSQQLAATLAKVGTLHLPMLKLEAGALVAERYRLVRFVGSGGMAWVYEARRETDGRRLALKLLHGRSNGEALARFAREAKLMSEVSHPGVVSVVDVDLTEEGVLFLVMEYVDGKSLDSYLDDDPAIAWSLIVLRQIAEGLAGVHARGIVHRDLKPANVLIEEGPDGPTAKIADFGVSLLVGDATPVPGRDTPSSGDQRVTRAGRVMGTPTYMAPELARHGRTLHASIDMYAFGVMAHELFVGRPPFRDPLFVRATHGRSLPPPASLALARPRLDRRFAECIDRCLSLDPKARPTAEEAARVLKDIRLDADPTSVPSVPVV